VLYVRDGKCEVFKIEEELEKIQAEKSKINKIFLKESE